MSIVKLQFLSPVLVAIAALSSSLPASAIPAAGSAKQLESNYIGVAGNIGISGGESALGVGNVSVISKFKLGHNLSFRPGAVFGGNTTVLLPLTYDFSVAPLKKRGITPYVGAGLAINTGKNSDVGALLTAGVDVPLTRQFTANVGLNAGFINKTSVGASVGIGYNF